MMKMKDYTLSRAGTDEEIVETFQVLPPSHPGHYEEFEEDEDEESDGRPVYPRITSFALDYFGLLDVGKPK